MSEKEFREITKENYKDYVFEKSPKSTHFKNMFWAFLIGGIICVFGQVLIELFKMWGFDAEKASVLYSSTLVAWCVVSDSAFMTTWAFRGAVRHSYTGFSNAKVGQRWNFAQKLDLRHRGETFLVAGPEMESRLPYSLLY